MTARGGERCSRSPTAPSVPRVEHWDVVVVGAGPAGAAAALGALRSGARVLVLDRADFPRDKVCGDAVAPEALDVLTGLGVDCAAGTDRYPPVPRLSPRPPLSPTAGGATARPADRIPRAEPRARLLAAARRPGAQIPPLAR